MELEFAVQPGVDDSYPVTVHGIVDWEPTIRALLEDDASPGIKAAKFHNTLVEAIVEVAQRIGEPKVALTGGCFQNKYLTERAVHRLRAEGFQPCWHQRVPPNDGGIALGQIVAAARARHAPAKLTEACAA
jgi:hydrogenase maturation protein HypF